MLPKEVKKTGPRPEPCGTPWLTYCMKREHSEHEQTGIYQYDLDQPNPDANQYRNQFTV